MNAHLEKAKKHTLSNISHPYVELDWTDIDSDMVRGSGTTPILSCGYANCSALVLFTPSGQACLSHMLTISTENQVKEYMQEMLTTLRRSGYVDNNTLQAVVIGGSGMTQTQNVCAANGITVSNSFKDPVAKGFDVLVYPRQKQIKVFCEDGIYAWSLSANRFARLS